MTRRDLLGGAAACGLSSKLAAAAEIPILDTHIHLFDPTRPQGVPWPPKENKVLYRPALPERYRKIAEPLGVKGAIEVEASPLLEDNQWVLDVAAKDPMIVGTVGDLEPGKPEFAAQLERFHRNPLFLGIRCGNLWGRDLAADIKRPEFLNALKLLAQAGLAMDTANQTPDLLRATLRITDRVPNLRIVIDHLPQMNEAPDIREFAKRPQVYAKVSEVLRRVDGRVPEDVPFYHDRLDRMWDTFGADRLLYGSDWPNSDTWAPYATVLRVVREYFMGKGREAAKKYFWTNSQAAYRWKARDASQRAA